MAKRVNVILPEDTVRTIDRIARPGQRSRFIERAVRHYVATASPAALHERLKAAVLRDRDLDLEIAQDWLAVDQAQWQQLPQPCGCRFRHSMCCCRRIRPQAWLFLNSYDSTKMRLLR